MLIFILLIPHMGVRTFTLLCELMKFSKTAGGNHALFLGGC